VKAGGDTRSFLTADYAFGYALEKDTSDIVTHAGGKVVGSVRVPLNSSDFSSLLLQAQSSKAKIVGLTNAGQIDLPVCERNIPGRKTNLQKMRCLGCFRPRTAVVARTCAGRRDHVGLSTTCPI
jgi:hypothetical protein